MYDVSFRQFYPSFWLLVWFFTILSLISRWWKRKGLERLHSERQTSSGNVMAGCAGSRPWCTRHQCCGRLATDDGLLGNTLHILFQNHLAASVFACITELFAIHFHRIPGTSQEETYREYAFRWIGYALYCLEYYCVLTFVLLVTSPVNLFNRV